MNTEEALQTRSESRCELCGATSNLGVYAVPPVSDADADHCAYICDICEQQIEQPEKIDIHHWRCLGESMWSQVPAVQVLAWRMLSRLREESWCQDLLDILYLDDDVLAWAKAGANTTGNNASITHVDSNGAVLMEGDTVTLVKDLNVKGANFTAKRGTAVRNIHLVADNAEHIEGRVNSQKIVILTRFVKKSG